MDQQIDVVIVGAGQAGAQVALALAEGGFDGSVAIVGAEPLLPYDRPPLSKGYLAGDVALADLLHRPDDFWASHGVEVVTDTEVVSVDPAEHRITTSSGGIVGYGQLVWAAGGRPRRLAVPGADLAGVHVLRSVADADSLRTALCTRRRVVIVGGGFIGLEAAASIATRAEVTVVEAADRVLSRVTSPVISDYFLRRHQEAGVRVMLSETIEAILGTSGAVSGVRLGTGTVIEADIVLVGVGLEPNVEPLVRAGATASNGVDVDGSCRTSLPDVFAVGDCANFANRWTGTRRMRLESVANAIEHGRVAAAALRGEASQIDASPWFWSHQYDVKLQTAGLFIDHDTAVTRGDPATGRFSVAYLSQGRLVAVDAVNKVRDFAQAKTLVGGATTYRAEDIADDSRTLKEIAQGLATAAM